jgi:hypothetical protein
MSKIPNYSEVKPQVIVRQRLDPYTPAIDQAFHPVIIGTQCDLRRYISPSERAEMSGTLFAAESDANNSQTIPFENIPSRAGTIDHSYTRLFIENGFLQLADFSTGEIKLENSSTPNIVKFETKVLSNLGNEALSADFSGLNVAAGDILKLNYSSKEVYRRVLSVAREITPASVAAPTASASNPAATVQGVANVTGPAVTIESGTFAPFDKPLNFNGEFADRYFLTAMGDTVGLNTVFTVSSASGLFAGTATFTYDGSTGHTSNSSLFGGATIKLAAPAVISAGTISAFTLKGTYTPIPTASLTIAGNFSGADNVTYRIEFVEGGPFDDGTPLNIRVSAVDGSDISRVMAVQAGDTVTIGTKGLSFTFLSSLDENVRAGDAFYVKATAAGRQGKYSVLILNGPVDIDNSISVGGFFSSGELLRELSGEIERTDTDGAVRWESTDNGIVLKGGLHLPVFGRVDPLVPVTKRDNFTRVFAQYRWIVAPDGNETEYAISNPAEIAEKLGVIHPDNPLAFGVYTCLMGCEGEVKVIAARVRTDDRAGYEEVLERLTTRRHYYLLVPLSTSLDVMEAVKLHVVAASAPRKRKFRKAYLPYNTEKEFTVLSTSVTVGIGDAGANRVILSSGDTGRLREKMVIRINEAVTASGGKTYESLVIKQVISDTEVLTTTAFSGGVTSVEHGVEIWADDTPRFVADRVISLANTLDQRRLSLIWSSYPKMLGVQDGIVIESDLDMRFAATFLAGVRVLRPVQQGLTLTNVSLISSSRDMYTKFSETLLDEIASSGVMILAQEDQTKPTVVRHQLTTHTALGPIGYEDNMALIIDRIAFAVDDIVNEYRGRYQLSTDLLSIVRTNLVNYLERQLLNDTGDRLSGPVIQSYRDLVIRIHPTIRSRMQVGFRFLVFDMYNSAEVTLNAALALSEDLAGEDIIEINTTPVENS